MNHARSSADTAHEPFGDEANPTAGAEPENADTDTQNGDADAVGDIDTQRGAADTESAGDVDAQGGDAADADPGEAA